MNTTLPLAAAQPPAASARPRLAAWRSPALRLASIVLCLIAWHLATRYRWDLGLLTFRNVPSPTDVAEAAWALAQSPQVAQHLGASLARVFSGFGIAAVIGIGLGLLIGRLRWAEDTLLPPLEVLRPIPAVAWIPLAILMFPSSEASMVFITFVGALFPILLNTVHGVEAVDPRLIASARSLGAGRLALFAEVVLPGALPSIVTGLAIGMGTAWFCLVTAEMISGQFGIGYYTWMSYTIQNYADIIVGMLLIGLLGMGSSALVRRAGAALMPWRRGDRP
ncbi:MAG: putative aliphatic sulfonates transport permease protein SsuC [Paracidovorax wautersii]|uniref:Putative aliphatic sulfonates transport permease protein SsuC n=1 Tax=Paracidovorax wautersii TaxID=1177982 RepID=A0A7V8FM92_9BURK|nr:MAG: putative aliphatic sulfonates transport permease protein SsuC [Paracidovorax wautersii]